MQACRHTTAKSSLVVTDCEVILLSLALLGRRMASGESMFLFNAKLAFGRNSVIKKLVEAFAVVDKINSGRKWGSDVPSSLR